MKETNKKLLKNIFSPGPRGKLRWAVFGIIILFILTFFIDVTGSDNIIAKKIDQGLSAIPMVNNLEIWPKIKQSSDGHKDLDFENIQAIDLTDYSSSFKLGLDLLGGTHLVYSADVTNIENADRASALAGVRDVIERRVNAFGVSEPVVQTNQVGDDWRVIVELAGVHEVNAAIDMIGETPLLEFKEENPEVQQLTEEQADQLATMNEEVKIKAQEVLDRALVGDDFVALAKEFSEDPGSKENGGSYQGITKGTFVPEYDEVIFNKLSVGEIYSELVASQFGYHIIKKDAERGTGDEREVDTSHILFKVKTAVDLGLTLEPEWQNTKLTGKQLKRSGVELNPQSGVPEVSLEFDQEGSDLFSDITKRNQGKLVAIFLDGYPISIPRVNEPILSGRAVISGGFNLADAKLLAQRLNAGALPVPISLISQTTIGASLGNKSIQKSLYAGIWGLAVVALFMILYYRLPGVLSVLALLIYVTVVLALFKLIPVTLTLAGIAGFILSIGIAVDANVLIFERLKEELKSGRELSSAVDEGFKRAWSSIRDSNVSSIITCLILYWFGTSIIRGFALTLFVGILVSMLSAIIITRKFLKVVVKWKISRNKWLYGVKGS